MSDHNKSGSSDEYVKLAMPYDEFDVLASDLSEEELADLGRTTNIEHLGAGTFSSPPFPATNGRIYGPNKRYMIPLVCQRAEKPTSKAVNVWFLVDTGSPFTCLTVKSLGVIFGDENVIHNVYFIAIQDQESNIECRVSKDHYKEVNLLGADSIQFLEVWITGNWKKRRFQLVKQ